MKKYNSLMLTVVLRYNCSRLLSLIFRTSNHFSGPLLLYQLCYYCDCDYHYHHHY